MTTDPRPLHGDDTRLGRELAELEASDPDVAAAARALDEAIDRLRHPLDYADPFRDER